MRLERKYITKKNQVKKFLVDKGQYEKIDNSLLDEYIFNLYLCDTAKEDILINGLTVNVVRNPDKDPLYQTNQAVTVYQNAIKNVNAILTKLGITIQERNKLKFQSLAKESDGFDD